MVTMTTMSNPSRHSAWVGLGSNLFNPEEQIKQALDTLSTYCFITELRHSSLYLSKPVGPKDQPDYINAVCTFKTHLSPDELLIQLQNLEQQQGRMKTRHWGERTLDLDILLYNREVISTDSLQIPHKEMLNRSFVVYPILEIQPNIRLPNHRLLKDTPLPENDLIKLDN